MAASCILPAFSIQQAITLLEQLYGLTAELQPLNGERDLNFLVTTETQKYVFKIANENESADMLDCQQAVFQLLADAKIFPGRIQAIASVNGNYLETVRNENGNPHLCRLLNYVDGRLLSEVNPHFPDLLFDLGKTLGQLDRSLLNFEHQALHRPLLWKMHEALNVLEEFKPFLDNPEKRTLIEYFETHFRDIVIPLDKALRRSAIHNDANDNNVLVNADSPWQQNISSIIDFGDMVHSWTVAEPAIAAAYAMLDKPHPLDTAVSIVKGYHQQLPLQEDEIRVLFDLICMRLCLSVCICAYQKSLEPDNDYLSISEAPAWRLLARLRTIPPALAQYVFRDACGFEAVPQQSVITSWLSDNRDAFHSVLSADLRHDPLLWLDLGVASPYFVKPEESSDTEFMTRTLDRAIADADCIAGVGGYGEYRLLYDDDAFVDWDGHQRSLHLGIDIFMPAGTPVFAPLDAVVFSIAVHPQDFDYGGCIILQHEIPQNNTTPLRFYTLYGHLSPESFTQLYKGGVLKAGEQIAVLGDKTENGRWPPHLHLQIMLDLLEETDNFFGAGSHCFRNVWLGLSPDPNLILGIPSRTLDHPPIEKSDILESRKATMNPSLSLSYRDPIHTLRGSMQYLYDETGRRYLDAVNNVPHVGHCHPLVVEAGTRQARLLNTNTRYLYSPITDFCQRLLAKFPEPLSVCYLVNSGSEANDLALRLARHYTGRADVVILDHAYHGNLGSLIDISPYKHDGKGGSGRPKHIHKADIPDYYRNPASTEQYADSVKRCLQQAKPGAAAFICETVLGCGGQVVLPEGYLTAAYAHAHAAGALCIADEVQVGFGRVGTHFWGFETQNVIPDIVTLGKPIGNGHPLAAVITTRAIADTFDNGMEYFNTFGGNPVSCAIGHAVLDAVETDCLQENALEVGNYLLEELRKLQARFPVIGDVRGLGLFIGVELVTDQVSKEPAEQQASYICERMKQLGVLISTDGPFHNVLKIKPPLCFNRSNADTLINCLTQVLAEDFVRV